MNTESTDGAGVGWDVAMSVICVGVGADVGVGSTVADGDTGIAVGGTRVAVAEALHATTVMAKTPKGSAMANLFLDISLVPLFR